jgi:ABC-type uncharacterized transport system auxiliary subunit
VRLARRPHGPVLVALLAIALVTAGCGTLSRKPPTKERFLLAPGAPSAVAAKSTAGILRVDVVRGAPLASNRGFVYRTGPDTVKTDFYREFVSPPGVLVRDAMIEWLRATNRFAAVARGTKAGTAWILESDLERLDADLQDPVAPQALIEMQVRLLDARTPTPTLLLDRRYVAREPLADRTPETLVAAWSRALATVLGEIEGDLTRATPTRSR